MRELERARESARGRRKKKEKDGGGVRKGKRESAVPNEPLWISEDGGDVLTCNA